jgi:hypothetical protein
VDRAVRKPGATCSNGRMRDYRNAGRREFSLKNRSCSWR